MNKKWFVLGCICLVLPFLIQTWDQEQKKNLIATYQDEIEKMADEDVQLALIQAYEYNEKLYKTGIIEETEYMSQLDVLDNQMLGTVEIPKINEKLPIYHGTEEDVLKKGIGHLKESSLPVGGVNTHSILAGHCGMSSAKLFTRLDELKKGDVFFVTSCNQKLGYRVCDIKTVKPDNKEVIEIQEGRDLVSLITCTPYGLNTHRLVVTGERIEMQEIEPEELKVERVSKRDRMFYLLPVLVLLIGGWRSLRKLTKKDIVF